MRSLCAQLALTLATASACAIASPARAQGCPTRPYWPTVSWQSSSAQPGVARTLAISALEDYAFKTTGAWEEQRGIRTDALLIVVGGEIIYERYNDKYDRDRKHLSWSMVKAVTSALTGVAIGAGALDLDDSICDHLSYVSGENCDITVRHLMQYTTGLDWAESYEDGVLQDSSTVAMLYGEGRFDQTRFVAAQPLRDQPGESYGYSTGDYQLLSGVVDAALRPLAGEHFPWVLLLDHVGLGSVTLERDAAGVFLGATNMYASARDYARFGFLYLNDGCWEGERVLPEGWVALTTDVSSGFRQAKIPDGTLWAPGMGWWLNRAVDEHGITPVIPEVPEDMYRAGGHWGQSITVFPSLDAIVVRLGDDRDPTFKTEEFLPLAVAVVEAS